MLLAALLAIALLGIPAAALASPHQNQHGRSEHPQRAGRHVRGITRSRPVRHESRPKARVATPAAAPKASGASRSAPSTATAPKSAASAPAAPAGTSANSGPAPAHVPTWAYDDGCSGGTGAGAPLVRQWLSYGESHCGSTDTKALNDCTQGSVAYCTPVEYLDASWIYATGSVPIANAAQESWWLHEPGHTDSAHRISVSAYGGGNLLNQTLPSVRAWFHDYVQSNFNPYPALMMDDSTGSLQDALYGTPFTTSDEITGNSQLLAGREQMAAALTHTDGSPFIQIDNGLTDNDNIPTPLSLLDNPSNVVGLVAEGTPMYDGTLTHYYSTLLDEMAYVDRTADDFVVLLSYDQSGSLRARRVQSATVMLGYVPGHVVSWADLEQQSPDLAVWPEEGIVPTDPIQTMVAPGGPSCLAGQGVVCSSGGHTSLLVAPGVYRREFADCYNRGTGFGACAAIVNTTAKPVTVQRSWLSRTYGYEITMTGGDVQSGGTVSLNGASFAPGTSTIGADDAVLLDSNG